MHQKRQICSCSTVYFRNHQIIKLDPSESCFCLGWICLFHDFLLTAFRTPWFIRAQKSWESSDKNNQLLTRPCDLQPRCSKKATLLHPHSRQTTGSPFAQSTSASKNILLEIGRSRARASNHQKIILLQHTILSFTDEIVQYSGTCYRGVEWDTRGISISRSSHKKFSTQAILQIFQRPKSCNFPCGYDRRKVINSEKLELTKSWNKSFNSFKYSNYLMGKLCVVFVYLFI